MNKTATTRIFLLSLLFLSFCPTLFAQRKMEKLDRGVVAIRTSPSAVYVGWRLLGNDVEGVAFNLYRGATKLNATPLSITTDFVDNTTTNATYTVRAVVNGVEQTASKPVAVLAQAFIEIPLQIPIGGTTPDGVVYTYTANDASVADLDGCWSKITEGGVCDCCFSKWKRGVGESCKRVIKFVKI